MEERPGFDQHEQSVHSQQNAGGDIYNVYVLHEASMVDGEVSRERIVEIIQQAKQVQKEPAPEAQDFPKFDFDAYVASSETIPKMDPRPYQPVAVQPADTTWHNEIQNVAAQNGDAWLPNQTQGLYGIDMTGTWNSQTMYGAQVHLQQFGAYVTLAATINGMPHGFGEGIINPSNWFVRFVGMSGMGTPVEVHATLYADWSLQGTQFGTNPWGMPMTAPFFFRKAG